MRIKDWNKKIYLLKGVLLAFIITIVLITIFSLLLSFTTIKESKMSIYNTVIMIISIAAGGFYSAKKLKENGWINGGLVGIIYYIILLIINILFNKPFSFDIFSITKLLIAFVLGVIGGIIGINL